jgi:hypothetical protein
MRSEFDGRVARTDKWNRDLSGCAVPLPRCQYRKNDPWDKQQTGILRHRSRAQEAGIFAVAIIDR